MTTIGRYEIRDQIGTGSMGIVYRAHDTQLDREVALKTIRTGMDVEPEMRERFFREARACARLQHPSIVTVYDLGEDKAMAYIAMELLLGSDFRQLIRGREELPLTTKIELMAQICEALGHAHRHGIIHRDVKPSNLFLINQQQAKVLDFGIARLPSSQLTIAGKILGTPNYMSPEQILGKPVDARSDLFSAAIVFFELLVYAHPFQGQSIPKRIVESEPDSVYDHDSSLPPLFEKIFARALAKDGTRRYRSGDEFGRDLRALLDVLKHNASTSPGLAQLPSERAVDVEPPPSVPKPDAPPPSTPPAEDPYEWRLSEIMRLIPEFEEALERGDESAARRLFTQLESIEAVDHRFSEAVGLCRSRLAAVSKAMVEPGAATQTLSAPPSDEDSTTAPSVCGACGTLNRSAARFCRACGEPLTNPTDVPALTVPLGAAAPQPAKVKTLRDEATRLFSSGTPGATVRSEVDSNPGSGTGPPAAQKSAERKIVSFDQAPAGRTSLVAGFSKNQLLVVAALLGLIVTFGLIALLLLNRSVPLAPAVAFARVSRPKTAMYKSPAADADTMLVLAANTMVNVLKTPRSRDQEWVHVQYVSPKGRVYRPGYVRTNDLTGWDSNDPETALSLIRNFWAEGAETEAQIDVAVARLRSFADRLHDGHVRREAQLLIAALEIKLAERLKSTGDLSSGWRERVKLADDAITAAGGDQTLQEQAAELRRKLELVSVPPTPAAAVVAAPPIRVTTSALLDRAEQYRHDHNFDAAEGIVEGVLKREPKNSRALQLREFIKQSREYFQ
jgi:serine/threonine protein kinase